MYKKEDLTPGAKLEMKKNFRRPQDPPDIVEIIEGPLNMIVLVNSINSIEIWYKVRLRGIITVMPEEALLKGHCGKYVGNYVNGIGSSGNTFSNKKPNQNNIFGIWISMLRRCYDISYYAYKYYGGNGYSVCAEWLCFELFLKQFRLIKDSNMIFTNVSRKYTIDILPGSKIYSCDTTSIKLFKDGDIALLQDVLRKNDVLPPMPDKAPSKPQIAASRSDMDYIDIDQYASYVAANFPAVIPGPVYNMNQQLLISTIDPTNHNHIDKETGRQMRIMCRIIK